MAGNLMRYSGLITKTRAMSGKLLSRQELNQLTELATVNEAVNFLKGTGGYGGIYRNGEQEWHRGQVEAVIVNSLYQDFEKLYQFADASQRTAFQYVFFRYEVDVLKRYLKAMFQERREESRLYVDSFFQNHAQFSVKALGRAINLQEFEQVLAGTPYEGVFMKLHGSGKRRYADYASALDIFYYSRVFREIRRMPSSDLKEILLEIYGTQIDWLNIMWIYRSRRFYSQTQGELLTKLIPCHFRLRQEELQRMVAAGDVAEMTQILGKTSYFKGKEAFIKMEDEISYRKTIRTMYQRVSRKYPVSIAPVLRFIYEKEQEMEWLTTIIEGIRYQIPPRDIRDMVLITI